MTATDIQHLLTGAPPGTTISIVSITIPGAAGQPTGECSTQALEQTANWSPEEVIDWVRKTYGDGGLKLRDWPSLLPRLSARELKRAVRENLIDSYRKPGGKDHGATMISPDAMLKYLESVHAPVNLISPE